jgi:hypothetical protein
MSLRKMYWKKSELQKDLRLEKDEQIKEYLQIEIERMDNKIQMESSLNTVRKAFMFMAVSTMVGVILLHILS